jgi:hypothetical protein
MKCLLLKEMTDGRGKKFVCCKITGNGCAHPVELGDEKTCRTYKDKFSEWFEKRVIEVAPEIIKCWHDQFKYDDDKQLRKKYTIDDTLDTIEFNIDTFVDDIAGNLDDLETDVSLIDEEAIPKILRRHRDALKNYAKLL